MSLFFTLLPIYVFGNLHCIGMCGPLVMLLGQHRYRYWYFAGRTLAFSGAGFLAGGLGAVLHHVLSVYHISALVSLMFGLVILVVGLSQFSGIPYPGHRWLGQRLKGISARFAQLLNQDSPRSVFLFGLGTIILPCGQTVIVYSACALYGDLWVGGTNGALFALFTSPSLWLAMRARSWLGRWRSKQHLILGGLAVLVGLMALCRGLADLQVIAHWVLNPKAPAEYHIVLY